MCGVVCGVVCGHDIEVCGDGIDGCGLLLLLSCPSHNFPHLRAHAFARYATVVRSSAVQASYSRRQERRCTIVCDSPQSQSTDWASSV